MLVFQGSGASYQKDGAGHQKDGAGHQKDGAGHHDFGAGSNDFGAGAKKGWQPAPQQKAKWLITSYLPQIDGAGLPPKIAPAPLSRPPAPKS